MTLQKGKELKQDGLGGLFEAKNILWEGHNGVGFPVFPHLDGSFLAEEELAQPVVTDGVEVREVGYVGVTIGDKGNVGFIDLL